MAKVQSDIIFSYRVNKQRMVLKPGVAIVHAAATTARSFVIQTYGALERHMPPGDVEQCAWTPKR